MKHFPILTTEGDINVVLIYNYYPQLTYNQSLNHFWRVNDSFFGAIMCSLDLGGGLECTKKVWLSCPLVSLIHLHQNYIL